jgi:hypothetical protein
VHDEAQHGERGARDEPRGRVADARPHQQRDRQDDAQAELDQEHTTFVRGLEGERQRAAS